MNKGRKKTKGRKRVKSKISAVDTGMSDDIRPIDPEGPPAGHPSAGLSSGPDAELEVQPPPNLAEPAGTQFQPPPDPGLSALEELLKASNQQNTELAQTDPAFMNSPKPSAFDLVTDPLGIMGIIFPTPEEVAAIENGDRLPTIAELEAVLESGSKVDIKPDGGVKVTPGIGPQPNGDYGIVVTVPEQLVSGVLGQAELDGVSPSEWLTVRLGEYLSQWFFGK
jgi:hypothetical protein